MLPYMNQYCYPMVWIPTSPYQFNGFQVNNFQNFYLDQPQQFLAQIPKASSNLQPETKTEQVDASTEKKEVQIQVKQKQSQDNLNEGKTEEQNQKEKLMKKLSNRPKTYLTQRQLYLKNQETGLIYTKERTARARIHKTVYISQVEKTKQIKSEEPKDKQPKTKIIEKMTSGQKSTLKKSKKAIKKIHKKNSILDEACLPDQIMSFEDFAKYKTLKTKDLLARKTNFN